MVVDEKMRTVTPLSMFGETLHLRDNCPQAMKFHWPDPAGSATDCMSMGMAILRLMAMLMAAAENATTRAENQSETVHRRSNAIKCCQHYLTAPPMKTENCLINSFVRAKEG